MDVQSVSSIIGETTFDSTFIVGRIDSSLAEELTSGSISLESSKAVSTSWKSLFSGRYSMTSPSL